MHPALLTSFLIYSAPDRKSQPPIYDPATCFVGFSAGCDISLPIPPLFDFWRQLDTQGIFERSHRCAYFLAISTTSSINPSLSLVGVSPRESRLSFRTASSFSGSSLRGFGK